MSGIEVFGKKNPNLPFYPAVRAGDYVFVSGQVGKDADGNFDNASVSMGAFLFAMQYSGYRSAKWRGLLSFQLNKTIRFIRKHLWSPESGWKSGC